MTPKTILVCLTDRDSAKAATAAACLLARRYNAHLIGLHVVESLMVYPGIAMHIPDTVYERYGKSQIDVSEAIKETFETATAPEDFVAEWRLLHCKTEPASERIIESARVADLVVMPAAPEDDFGTQGTVLETVIRNAGRPVLVVPRDWSGDSLGHSALVGWNGSREAARAAHDAMALLGQGDAAHILRVKDGQDTDDRDPTSSDLAAAFDRQGIKATVTQKNWQAEGVAAALNADAFQAGADMIAIGAFGHSRAYDFVIGAATRDLLRVSQLPVLFSR